MNRAKKICSKCKREISLSNFKRHFNSCEGILKDILKINPEWKQPDEKYKCPYCENIYSKKGIMTHIWSKHTEKGKLHFQGYNFGMKGKPAWNKGLSKYTDKRVQKYAKTLINNIKLGKTIPSFKGKTHKTESIEKISKSRIKYLQEHPDMVPYLVNHSSHMSYPEELLFKKLTELNIDGWIYNFQNGIYQYDFAWPEFKLDVEVDGGTHQTEKVKKIDERRDKFSKDNGWIVLRFSANDIKYNIDNCIQQIKNKL